MILLDTHVVSEAMKAEPHTAVRLWLDAQAAETLYLSRVTLAFNMRGGPESRTASCWHWRP